MCDRAKRNLGVVHLVAVKDGDRQRGDHARAYCHDGQVSDGVQAPAQNGGEADRENEGEGSLDGQCEKHGRAAHRFEGAVDGFVFLGELALERLPTSGGDAGGSENGLEPGKLNEAPGRFDSGPGGGFVRFVGHAPHDPPHLPERDGRQKEDERQPPIDEGH